MTAEAFFKNWGEVIDFSELSKCLKRFNDSIWYSQYVSPSQENVFRAFAECNFNDLKVVMLGEDPYPQPGIATGLAFGNKENTPIDKWSPSLKVLYNAAISSSPDLPQDNMIFPTLEAWARQGVLLLNSALTVKNNEVGSHLLIWRNFIIKFLINLSSKRNDVVYLCLGSTAKEYIKNIQSDNIVICNHPAWYARENKPMPDIFTVVNEKLVNKLNKTAITWV